jgi:hypothetical protein
VPVSVAELCRRLGPVPATADSLATGATPVLVGDLLRREGRPLASPDVAAEIPEARADPDSDSNRAVPAPRSRAEACKTALGAGGLVVAGSVLGAALLAAAGVGGPLPSFQGDDGTEQFQGEGTLVRPGVAYGSVSGRDVVASSGLLRTISYYTPWGDTPPSPTAAVARPASVASLPLSVPAQNGGATVPIVGNTAGGAGAAPVGPQVVPSVVGGTTGGVGSVVNGTTDGVGSVVNGTTGGVGSVVNGTTDGVTSVVNGTTDGVTSVIGGAGEGVISIARPVVEHLEPVVPPVAAVVAPTAAGLMDLVEPVADLVGVTAGEPLTDLAGPVATPAVAAAEDLGTGGSTALPDTASQVVRGATSTATAVLPGAASAATTLTETATDAAGPATEVVQDVTDATPEVVPPALRTADAPADALPVVDQDGLSVREVSPTEPLPIISPVDPLDLPTTPLRVVAPDPSETDGPQSRAEADDDAEAEHGQTGAETDDADDDADAPEPRRGSLGETLSRVTGG